MFIWSQTAYLTECIHDARLECFHGVRSEGFLFLFVSLLSVQAFCSFSDCNHNAISADILKDFMKVFLRKKKKRGFDLLVSF